MLERVTGAIYFTVGALDATREFVSTRMSPFGCGYARGDLKQGDQVKGMYGVELHDHRVWDPQEKLHTGTPDKPIAVYLTDTGIRTYEPYDAQNHGPIIAWTDEGQTPPGYPSSMTHDHSGLGSGGAYEI